MSSKTLRPCYNLRSKTVKNVIRAFVVALTLAGSVAYTQVNATVQTKTAVAKLNSMPMPCCPPDDPNACDIRGGH